MKTRAKRAILGAVRTIPVGQHFTSKDIMRMLPGNYDPIPSEVTHILPTLSEIERVGMQGKHTVYTRRDPDEV